MCDSPRNRGASLLSPVCCEPSISRALIWGGGLVCLVGPASWVQILTQECLYCVTWRLLFWSHFFKRARHRRYCSIRAGALTANNRAPWGFPSGSTVKNPPANAETRVPALSREDALEEETAAHSSVPAWRIPWTEEPGSSSPTDCRTARHDLAAERQPQSNAEHGFQRDGSAAGRPRDHFRAGSASTGVLEDSLSFLLCHLLSRSMDTSMGGPPGYAAAGRSGQASSVLTAGSAAARGTVPGPQSGRVSEMNGQRRHAC